MIWHRSFVLCSLASLIVPFLGDTVEAAELQAGTYSGTRRSEGELTSPLHPLMVKPLPAEAEQSISSLGAYLIKMEPNVMSRAKAIHDWLATRIEYDYAALRSGSITWELEAPEVVFRRRSGVCAGFAQLGVAIGASAGVPVRYVKGLVRDISKAAVKPSVHAWNEVTLDGTVHAFDATWDAGTVSSGHFLRSYRADYRFTEPSVFMVDHLPEALPASWPQKSKADFMDQPSLSPRFFADGLGLISPTRFRTESSGSFSVTLLNPNSKTIAGMVRRPDGRFEDCETRQGSVTVVVCPLRTPGAHLVEVNSLLHAAMQPDGSGTRSYARVAWFEAVGAMTSSAKRAGRFEPTSRKGANGGIP